MGIRSWLQALQIQLQIQKEYQLLVTESDQIRVNGERIKQYLLDVLADNHNDVEKFSDSRLLEAQKLVDDLGGNAMYWMTDIAACMVDIVAAKYNDIATNVDQNIKGPKTPEAIVHEIVRTSRG